MMNLSVGGNTTIPPGVITIKINSGLAVDASAFRLFANGKVKDDLDMVFYGQPKNDNGSISWKQQNNSNEFLVNLSGLAADVQKVALAITCDKCPTIHHLNHLSIQLESNNEVIALGKVEVANRQEAALIMGELYRRNNEWKFRFIAQGFNGGLKPLAEHFGVNVADEPVSTPPVTNPPANQANSTAASSVNLTKISLSKDKTSVSLIKKDDYGKIGINLNWHKNEPNQKGGLFGGLFAANKDIDLDVGAFVRLRDGSIHVIQALGNCFGSLQTPCYVELQGDDRTGTNKNGEWIYVNGSQWNKIDEVLVYAFIYQGVPSWSKTDGVVRIHVPEQPIIETHLTEGDNNKTLSAIARLVNDNGAIKVERINRYFKNQLELDNAYGWGFNWRHGRK